jgi:hypothetical protein
MAAEDDIEWTLSRADQRRKRKLLRAIDRLEVGDLVSLNALLKPADTRVAMAVYEELVAGLSLDEYLGRPEPTVWHEKVMATVYAELQSRGLTFVPASVDDIEVFPLGTWWGVPSKDDPK